jgi:cyclopropane fatty-acyl-phospholipid synthase-like methyltransferase
MRHRILERTDYLVNACRGKKVLHVGCADTPYTAERLKDGTLLHGLIEQVAAAQYGIDLSASGIALLRESDYHNLAVADAEHLATSQPFGAVEFDVIVAGEIIEHLPNPGLFLENLKPLLRQPSARLILTTINTYCAHRFLYSLLTRRESVHPDHICYFSEKTLTRLVTGCGYEVEDFAWYPVGREHERALKHGRAWLLWWADRLAYRFNETLADGLMMTCRVKGAV